MGIPADISSMLTFPAARNGGADNWELTIEKFNGEVATILQAKSVTDGLFDWTPLVGTDTLSNAAMGDPTITKLDPGVSPTASKILTGDQHVQVRQPVIARVAIGVLANVQDRLNVKGRTPDRMGKVIARLTDEVLLHQCIKAAFTTTGPGAVTGFDGGLTREMPLAGDETDGDKLERELRYMSTDIEEKENELADGRCFLSPSTFGYLLDADKLVNSDYGDGRVQTMALKRVADMPLQKTVRLPKVAKAITDVDSNPWLLGADYAVTADHAKVLGLFAKRDAIMIASAIPVTSEIWWDPGTKSFILDTYIAFGAGVNDSREAAVLLKKTA